LFVGDPEPQKIQFVKRRRSKIHRRNRVVRRWLVAAVALLFIGGASTAALRYLSPSLFQSGESLPTSFAQAELSRRRLIDLNQVITSAAPDANRPVYPYSLVPGGVEDAKELKWVAEHDPIVAAHYAGFDYDHARVVRLTLAQTVFMSYRIGNRVYWTRHRLTLHKGEKVITDGRITARARCGNRVEQVPQQAAAAVEPPEVKFDQPIKFPGGTAMQAPPVPFESAFNHPTAIGATGPLSLYDTFTGGGLIPISPPPLPAGLCGPTKKGKEESGCCVGGEGNGKKKKNGCGGPTGVVPEPSTWVMLATGLVGIYWMTRRRLVRI